MTSHQRPESVAEMVPCDVCHKEIPLSIAKTFEAEDYVSHFCGLECYSKWKQRSEALEQPHQEYKR